MTKLSHLSDCFCCLSHRVHVHQGSPLDFPCQTSPDTPQHDISDKIHSRVDNKITMRSRVEFVTGSLCEDDPPQQLLRVNCSEGSSGKNHISQEQIKSDVMCMTGVRSGCCSEEEEVHRKSNLHIMAGCVLQEPLGLQICQTCGGTIHLHYDDEKENCKNCLIHHLTKNYDYKNEVYMELPNRSFDLQQQQSSSLHKDEEWCQIIDQLSKEEQHTGQEGSSSNNKNNKKQDCNIHPTRINESSCCTRRDTDFERCEKCGGWRRRTDTEEQCHTVKVCKVCHHPVKDHNLSAAAQGKNPPSEEEERNCFLHPDVQECKEGKDQGSSNCDPYKQKLETCQGYCCHTTTGDTSRWRSQDVEEDEPTKNSQEQKGKMKKKKKTVLSSTPSAACLQHSAQQVLPHKKQQSKQISVAKLEMGGGEEESHHSDSSIHADPHHHHQRSRFLEKDPNPFHVHLLLPAPTKRRSSSSLHEQCSNHKRKKEVVPTSNSQACFHITQGRSRRRRRRSTQKKEEGNHHHGEEKFVTCSYRDGDHHRHHHQSRGEEEACGELEEVCPACCHPMMEHHAQQDEVQQTSCGRGGGGEPEESSSTRRA